MFLDDDDEFMPDKISRQLQRLQSLDDSWAACYTAYIRKLNDKIIMYSGERREGFLLVDELGRNLFVHAGSNLMIRRHVVSEVGGFDESFDRNQDIEFLVRILKNYKLAYVDYQGLIVHITNKTKSTDFIILTEQYLEKFSSEISQLPPKNRDKVKCLIDLQKFRYFLMKRRFQNAYKVFIESKLPLYLLIKYLWYLVYRRLRKKAYGFKV